MNKLFVAYGSCIQYALLNIQDPDFVLILLFNISLLPIACCDLKSRYIPDRLMLLSGTIAVVHRLYPYISDAGNLARELLLLAAAALITALPFILLYFLRDDIGGADAKLAAVTGAQAGVENGLRILLLASVISFLLFSIHYLITKKNKQEEARAASFRYPLLPGICFSLSLATLRFPPFSY